MTTPTQITPPEQPTDVDVTAQPVPRPRQTGLWVVLCVILLALLIAVVYVLRSRRSEIDSLQQAATPVAVASVTVIHPEIAKGTVEIELPGDTDAYTDTPIYARSDGYLRRWLVDIGAHVKKDQLIAQIETPELDEQLQGALAALKSSQADLALAKTTSTRYQNLLRTNSVSRQETEQAQSNEAVKTAAVESAEANVHRLQKMQGFENIYAPFTGTITARNVDVGDLIQAGPSGNPKELFHLASVGKLRVYVAVPQIYSAEVRNGAAAWLTLKEYPGRKFSGTVVRNSGMIDKATRTLRVEVDVDNADGTILPGAYVSVHFAFTNPPNVFTLPSNALLFRSEGLNVVLVRNDHAVLQPIVVAHDNGKSVDVSNGVSSDDLIVLNPPDSLMNGQVVRPILTGAK
jgi:RND family efflux transporter MFP subunit